MSTEVVCAIEASSKRRTNPTLKPPIGALDERRRCTSHQEIPRGRQPWNPTIQKTKGGRPAGVTPPTRDGHRRDAGLKFTLVSPGKVRMQEKTERWKELCALAAVEQDPHRLVELVSETVPLLDAKQRRLNTPPPEPPNANDGPK